MILELTRPVQGGLRQERKLDAVSNNLANVDTNGFKKDVISFDRKFKAVLTKDYSQGDVTETGNPFDLAIGGSGFFKIDTAQGIQYTRNGTFTLDAQGALVDGNGNPVLGQGGPIIIDLADAQGQDPHINEAGEIIVNGEIVDTLDIVTFADLQKLEKKADNLYEYMGENTDEIIPDIIGLKQRAVEKSNVQVVDEMVKMIDFHRMFETFTKSMLTFDDIDSKVINEVGKPR